MLSMEPSIKRGLTFWDRATMPFDEYEERIRLVRAAMHGSGLRAMIIAGNMYQDADLLWLTAGNVDGVLVLPVEGEPAIFTNSGSRESFFLRELTWLQDLSYRGAVVGDAVRAALEARGIPSGRIGTAGLSVLSLRQLRDLRQALSSYQVEDASTVLRTLRATPRPRERRAVAMALGMAAKAAHAAESAFAAGASNTGAMIEAEHVARCAGAWDVRILANLSGAGLRPFEAPSDARHEPLLLWIAARYQGYWADQVIGSSSRVSAALNAMLDAVRPGVAAHLVACAGLGALPEDGRDQALGYGLGGGIGMELVQPPIIHPDSTDVLSIGGLLSLRVLTDAGLASCVAEIGPDGALPVQPQNTAGIAAEQLVPVGGR